MSPPEYYTTRNKEVIYWTLLFPTPLEMELTLPWRPGTRPHYPEVQEGFLRLREEAEKVVRQALLKKGELFPG